MTTLEQHPQFQPYHEIIAQADGVQVELITYLEEEDAELVMVKEDLGDRNFSQLTAESEPESSVNVDDFVWDNPEQLKLDIQECLVELPFDQVAAQPAEFSPSSQSALIAWQLKAHGRI